MTPKTIDISTGPELLREADPIGLLTDPSVTRYVERLRGRVAKFFPKARIFVRWSPVHNQGTDVYTIPRAEDAEARVEQIAAELRNEPEEWIRYDEQVRAALAVC